MQWFWAPWCPTCKGQAAETAKVAAGNAGKVNVGGGDVALTRTTAVTRLRRLGAIAPRLGGGLLLLAGAYVAYYGWYEIRAQDAPATADPVIDAAGSIQRTAADALETAGPAVIAAVFAVLLLAALLIRRRRRTRRKPRTGLGSSSAAKRPA